MNKIRKKQLWLGLLIIIVVNLVVLAGVAYNRSGEPTAQLQLTERELGLPYNSGFKKENSSTSLRIKWRVNSQQNDEGSYNYWQRELIVSGQELLALGFGIHDKQNIYWAESKALYWALEYDGVRYQEELERAQQDHQQALDDYKALPNKKHKGLKEQATKWLEQEQMSNSRLFFVELAADYQSLADKYSGNNNILIVKGLVKPYYRTKTNDYGLGLHHLLVEHIMLSLPYADKLKNLSQGKRFEHVDKPMLPRYSVEVNWGQRLEPWVTGVQLLGEQP